MKNLAARKCALYLHIHFPDNTLSAINIIKINALQSKILHLPFCFKTYNYHRMLVFIFSIPVGGINLVHA